jgi:ATP/ADP translocase
MELRRHNNIKTMRRKKSQTVVKDTEPKDKAKGSINGGGKKMLRSPHIVHISLIRILQSSTVIISKNHQNEVKWRQLQT